MLRVATCFLAALLLAPPAGAQVTYTAALAAGNAFMVDADDADPGGSFSMTAALQRRHIRKALSTGVEAGLHRYLVIRQDLAPDVSGWASKLEDTRKAWRVTPFIRWQTGGADVHVYGQLGAGLYIRQSFYLQQERQAGGLVVNTTYGSTDPLAGVNVGLGLELFGATGRVGAGLGFRAHSTFGGGGDGFYTGEIGIALRIGRSTRALRGMH